VDKEKIIKYIRGTSTPAENNAVKAWIASSVENEKRFHWIKAEYIASTFDETTKRIDLEKGIFQYKENIRQHIENRRKKVKITTLKYAAMSAVVFGLGCVLYLVKGGLGSQVEITDNAIKLELESGNTQVIKEDGSILVLDSEGREIGAQKGQSLVYSNKVVKEVLEYNTLRVPYGKRFNLLLSDGTRIILNAGTSLKYPIQFIKGSKREVFLCGEAFFEVAKDSSHPFVVNTKGLDVNVLGTRFNVSAYPEDSKTSTVLAEGSVRVHLRGRKEGAEKPILLTPAHMAAWEKSQNKIKVDPVDVNEHIAWVSGRLVFKSKPFSEILKVLERHYNVSIINNYTFLNDQKFLAKFDSETIEEVLRSFQTSEDFSFEINGNKIEINQPLKHEPMT
tara:strand:- start:44701 stop:45876 length:1176 start_codon:yes stop_codon:yes gene_type:complete